MSNNSEFAGIIHILLKRGLKSHVAEDVAREIIEALDLEDEEETVGGWSRSDVARQANRLGVVLTESEAEHIFDVLRNKFDASVGINWDAISYRLSQFDYGRAMSDEEKQRLNEDSEPVIAP